MKTNKIVSLFLVIGLLLTLVCPAFAVSELSVKTDKATYKYGEKVIVSGTAEKAKIIRIKSENSTTYSLYSAVDVENGVYEYKVQLPSATTSIWPTGKYTVEVGEGTVIKTTTFTISSGVVTPTVSPTTSPTVAPTTSPTATTKPSGGGSSSGGGGSIIVGPGTGIGTGTGTGGIGTGIQVNVDKNQLEKSGIPSGATVVATGTKLSNDTFNISVTVNGAIYTNFKGFDPITVKIPYTPASGVNTANLVVVDAQGNIVPIAIYKDGNIIVATNNTAGTFSIREINKTFNDVNHPWAEEAISALAARDILNGVGDNNFDPDRPVTRAEFIKLIVTMFNIHDVNAVNTFADVDSNEWYASYVATAYDLGITRGYGEDNTFRPQNTISREEMTAMLARAAEVLSVNMPANTAEVVYNDDASIQDYAKASVYKMQQAGILRGVGDGLFDAQGSCTRAQAAVAIYNMFGVSLSK